MNVLDAIGRTRLIPLQHMAPKESARILVKLEYENPTGSMKDRMALAMVEAAEADGRLRPGGSVVEYTGGSTGVSLAFVCAAKRIPLQIVTSEASSKEKRDHMAALGARRRDPDGIDSGSDGDRPSPRPARRNLRRHLHGRKRGGGAAGRRTSEA